MSYHVEMNEAIERSKRFNISSIDLNLIDAKFYSDEKCVELIGRLGKKYGGLSPNHLIGKCLQAHFDILEDVRELFHPEAIFTLGYIFTGENYYFEFTEKDVVNWLKNKVDKNHVNLHAWITLPSLEVIDITFPLTYAKMAGLEESPIVLFKHVDEFINGMQYHPVIAGEEFLFDLGLVESISMQI